MRRVKIQYDAFMARALNHMYVNFHLPAVRVAGSQTIACLYVDPLEGLHGVCCAA